MHNTHDTACYLNAAEFALEIPPGVIIFSHALPFGARQLGSLRAGLSVAYWPLMDGWNPGYNLLCLFEHTGLTSIICPFQVGVQETNWGAIKSLF